MARGPARMRHGTQGHVAAPRAEVVGHVAAPRGSTRGGGRTRGKAMRVHVEAQVAPRGRVRGWQVMGPQVSGPRLDSWGGNANALFRPTFYTYHFLSFSPCGTMFL